MPTATWGSKQPSTNDSWEPVFQPKMTSIWTGGGRWALPASLSKRMTFTSQEKIVQSEELIVHLRRYYLKPSATTSTAQGTHSIAYHVITSIFQTCLSLLWLLEATFEGQFLLNLPATALQLACSLAGWSVVISNHNCFLQLKEGYDNVLAKSRSSFFPLNNIT